jgi:hypothetical protein
MKAVRGLLQQQTRSLLQHDVFKNHFKNDLKTILDFVLTYC